MSGILVPPKLYHLENVISFRKERRMLFLRMNAIQEAEYY